MDVSKFTLILISVLLVALIVILLPPISTDVSHRNSSSFLGVPEENDHTEKNISSSPTSFSSYSSPTSSISDSSSSSSSDSNTQAPSPSSSSSSSSSSRDNFIVKSIVSEIKKIFAPALSSATRGVFDADFLNRLVVPPCVIEEGGKAEMKRRRLPHGAPRVVCGDEQALMPLAWGPWKAVRCPPNHLRCSKMEECLQAGPFRPLFEKLEFVDNKTSERMCCAFVDHGVWAHALPHDLLDQVRDAVSRDEHLSNLQKEKLDLLHIEKILNHVPRTPDRPRVDLRAALFMTILGLSQLPRMPANVTYVSSSSSGKERHEMQMATRIILPGNSLSRLLVSSFASLFRGMKRHLDRGAHHAVRYSITTHGDYFSFDSGKAALHPNTSSLDALIPLKLKNPNERVIIDVLYDYVQFLEIFYDGKHNEVRHDFQRASAVFLRPYQPVHVKQLVKWRYSVVTAFLQDLLKLLPNSSSSSSSQPLVVFLGTYRLLYERMTYGSYEPHYIHQFRALGRGRDHRRFVVAPPERYSSNTDGLGKHSACILHNHYPRPVEGFSFLHTQDAVNRTHMTCTDWPSAAHWFRFGLVSFLTGKATTIR